MERLRPNIYLDDEDLQRNQKEEGMKKDMEGQFRKDDAANDNMWEVTAVGKKDLLARVWRDGEVVQGEQRYSIGDFKGAYPVVVDVEGNPVDPEPAVERRCEIDWKPKYAFYDDGTGEYHVHDVVGRRDFVAFKAEDGTWMIAPAMFRITRRHSTPESQPYPDLCPVLPKEVLDNPDKWSVETVRAKWVILEPK